MYLLIDVLLFLRVSIMEFLSWLNFIDCFYLLLWKATFKKKRGTSRSNQQNGLVQVHKIKSSRYGTATDWERCQLKSLPSCKAD